MDIEKFRKLKVVKKGEGRRKIVDWNKVLKAIRGTVFTKKEFEAKVKELFPQKKKVNYSEMYRVLESWQKNKVKVEVRQDEDNNVLYLVS